MASSAASPAVSHAKWKSLWISSAVLFFSIFGCFSSIIYLPRFPGSKHVKYVKATCFFYVLFLFLKRPTMFSHRTFHRRAPRLAWALPGALSTPTAWNATGGWKGPIEPSIASELLLQADRWAMMIMLNIRFKKIQPTKTWGKKLCWVPCKKVMCVFKIWVGPVEKPTRTNTVPRITQNRKHHKHISLFYSS